MEGFRQKKGSRFKIGIFRLISRGRLPMFHFFTLLIGLYVAARFVPSLPVGIGGKWLVALGILLVSQYYLFGRLSFGGMASPEIPFGALAFLGGLFGALILLAVFLLLKDVVSLFWWTGYKIGWLPSEPIPVYRINVALAISALVLAAIGVWQAVRVPDVRRVDITLNRLPPEWDGLKLVQLTDLHASRLFEAPWMRAVVSKTNALNPDLIVITGDLVDGTTANRARDVAPLKDLKARLGVFVVTGNHEYYSNYRDWMAAFDRLGLSVLKNSHVVLSPKGSPLVLAGVTDRVAAGFGLPAPDVETALSGTPDDAPVILLAHQPKGAARYADAGVDLQLSGHTHGGQVLGIHWLTQLANEGYVSGRYRVGDMELYVSNGTGLWNGFPLRLGKPSEITEIVLYSGQRP